MRKQPRKHAVTAFRREEKEATAMRWKLLLTGLALTARRRNVCITTTVSAMRERSAWKAETPDRAAGQSARHLSAAAEKTVGHDRECIMNEMI